MKYKNRLITKIFEIKADIPRNFKNLKNVMIDE